MRDRVRGSDGQREKERERDREPEKHTQTAGERMRGADTETEKYELIGKGSCTNTRQFSVPCPNQK